MNMREEILSDYSKAHALKIASHACASAANFKALMKCFMSDEYRLAQRAAWSVCWAAKKKPEMIVPHVKELVAAIEKENVHDAVIRNALRVLQDIDIPEKYHGIVLNACFNFIEKPTVPIAFKAFSLSILEKLSKEYPEIKAELRLIIEENWEHSTPAFKSRGRKILAKL